jgi:hypothetical protein
MTAADAAITIEIVIDNMRYPLLTAQQNTQRILLAHNAQHFIEYGAGYQFGQDEYYGNYDLYKDVGEMIRDDVIGTYAKRENKLDTDEVTFTSSIFSALLSLVDWNLVGEHYVQSAREKYHYRWETAEQYEERNK